MEKHLVKGLGGIIADAVDTQAFFSKWRLWVPEVFVTVYGPRYISFPVLGVGTRYA